MYDEDGNEIEEAPAEEAEEEAKKPKWNPADYKWTVTNRKAKNLPQLFRDYKGVNCIFEEPTSESFSPSQTEAVTKALDSFCKRVLEDRSIYLQVIFK